MAYENEKKMLSNEWEEKIHSFYTPMDFQTPFGEMHLELLEIENVLEEAGMSGLNYRDMENEILACKDLLVKMNVYIPSVLPELQICLDKPLYKHFDKGATEALSRIHMEDYTTENTLGIKTHTQVQSGYAAGNFQHLEKVKNKLSIEDFLGLTMNKSSGNIIDVPNDFKVFTDLFKTDYEITKENLNKHGKDITLEEYLIQLQTMGEYQHTMNQPVKQFVSNLLDVTIIKPFIEACTGKEFITGEDLSDFDRNMKGISAVIGIVTLGQSGFWRMPLKEGLEFLGKSVMLDMISTGASYGTSELCKKCNLPEPITLLLSGMAGISVSIVGGKYIFKKTDGTIIYEQYRDKTVKHVESFNNWEEMKKSYKGVITKFVDDNKPLGATHPREWLKKEGTSLEIEFLYDGTQIWNYTKNGVTVPFVPQEINGKLQKVIKFPEEYLHIDKDIAEFKINGNFSGNRLKDKKIALEYLKSEGYDKIPTGYVLHHDVKNGVFQLVRQEIHQMFSHYGGHYYYK